MAFSSIQQIMAQLARQLKERLAGSPAALWNVRGEVAAALPPAEEIEHDVPRVVLQAGVGSFAISGSQHRCFRYDCEMVLMASPDSAGMDAEQLMPALALLGETLGGILREWKRSPLVDPADGVAAAYCVDAHVSTPESGTAEQLFVFRQTFVLVIQF